ncbi:hypothetical protein Salat_2614500 [Sesamum alatum]|uniref:DUF4283 domain-containing protein n=1 Tax=Sesamum alatum TaxID=300844 RepID=A0AAE1XNG1_9LAMI|nr:hypothetical protein Salat_2614500 [Sesamum alatum]
MLAGQLLSHHSINFDALKNILVQLSRLVQGLVICKVMVDRFCLVFSHVDDLKCTMEMRPWTFGCNLLLLQWVPCEDDPTTDDLDWSPFFIHVLDVRFVQRTIDVVRYIGWYLDAWRMRGLLIKILLGGKQFAYTSLLLFDIH